MTHRPLHSLLDAFAPRRCPACGAVSPAALCTACAGMLSAQPVPAAVERDGGLWLAAFEYRDPLRHLIHGAKYRGALPALRALSALAAERIATQRRPERGALVAIPLGRRRLGQRGYNQAEIVAEALAGRMGLTLVRGLIRVRETPPQSEMRLADRLTNLRGAFCWEGASPSGSLLWLVDDVVTTGATAAAASRAVRAAGAARVGVISLAIVP